MWTAILDVSNKTAFICFCMEKYLGLGVYRNWYKILILIVHSQFIENAYSTRCICRAASLKLQNTNTEVSSGIEESLLCHQAIYSITKKKKEHSIRAEFNMNYMSKKTYIDFYFYFFFKNEIVLLGNVYEI